MFSFFTAHQPVAECNKISEKIDIISENKNSKYPYTPRQSSIASERRAAVGVAATTQGSACDHKNATALILQEIIS